MNENSTRNQQLLLSFSGIDGAGKSTQISRLHQALRLSGLRVKLITFWDDVAVLRFLREEIGHKVFKGDRGVGSPEAPIRRLDKNIRSPLLTLFRMVIYFFDALSLRLVAKKLRREQPDSSRADVIIFDRFIYDELANLNLKSVWVRFYIRALLWLVPRPNLAFVLDADPEAAFARKPEYPLEFLHSNREAYIILAKMAGMIVIAPSSIEEAHREILSHVHQVKRTVPAVDAVGHVSGEKLVALKGDQKCTQELTPTAR